MRPNDEKEPDVLMMSGSSFSKWFPSRLQRRTRITAKTATQGAAEPGEVRCPILCVFTEVHNGLMTDIAR